MWSSATCLELWNPPQRCAFLWSGIQVPSQRLESMTTSSLEKREVFRCVRRGVSGQSWRVERSPGAKGCGAAVANSEQQMANGLRAKGEE